MAADTPTPQQWAQLESLLDRALDLPEAERAAFIATQPLEPAARAELERWLAAELESRDFLSSSNAQALLANGERIGDGTPPAASASSISLNNGPRDSDWAKGIIKIGAPLALTGGLADEGKKQQVAYDMWLKRVNAAGGINVGGKKMKVELEDPYVLIHEKKLTGLQTMLPLLEGFAKAMILCAAGDGELAPAEREWILGGVTRRLINPANRCSLLSH